MVGAAADWCSLEPRCRGFTISAEVHDDRLHWVRFSSNGRVVLSAEWMSYLKEPTAARMLHRASTPNQHEITRLIGLCYSHV